MSNNSYTFTSPATVSKNEGETVTFSISTTNVSNGTVLYWAAISDTGAGPQDASNPSPPLGTVTISSNTGTINLTLARDTETPETGESLYLRLYSNSSDRDLFQNHIAQSNVVTIINLEPSYIVTVNSTSVVNGQTLTYTITTSNLDNGTVLYITDSGTAVPSMFNDGLSQTTVTVNNNTANFVRTIKTPLYSSATSILNIRTNSFTGTIRTNAPTVTLVPQSFNISVFNTSLNDGQSVTYLITTTNVINGTIVYLTENGSSSRNVFLDGLTKIPITINNNAGILVRTVNSPLNTTLESITSILQLRLQSFSGTVLTTAETVYITPKSIKTTAALANILTRTVPFYNNLSSLVIHQLPDYIRGDYITNE